MNAAARLEAVLLASPRPVPLATLLSAIGLSKSEARTAIAELEARYSPDSSGIVLRGVAGGYQLATNPRCAGVVERFREEARPAPLSGAAHEVLACALYLGPLTRGAVSKVRGVNSDAVVRSLLDRGLLAEVSPDTESPGSPALLDVTEDFLAAAGATGREDFPPLDSLVGEEELARVRGRVRVRDRVSSAGQGEASPGDATTEAPVGGEPTGAP